MARLNEPGIREGVVARYTQRRVDRAMKMIDLSAGKSVPEIIDLFAQPTASLDIGAIAAEVDGALAKAERDRDMAELLKWFDDKQLLATAARILKGKSKAEFVAWIGRVMKSEDAPDLKLAIKSELPAITPLGQAAPAQDAA